MLNKISLCNLNNNKYIKVFDELDKNIERKN